MLAPPHPPVKRSKVVTAALEMVEGGRVAFICCGDDRVLHAYAKPKGSVILKVRPGEKSTSKSLSILLNHRMRMLGLVPPRRRRAKPVKTVKPPNEVPTQGAVA